MLRQDLLHRLDCQYRETHKEHNSGRAGAKYTRARRPVKLVYVEPCSTLSMALKREAQIKRLSRLQKVLLIAKGKRVKDRA